MKRYVEFLKSKIEIAPESGFHVDLSEINPILKPHQRDAVQWAVKGGRRALFEAFGLGKTIQQLEYLRLVAKHEDGKVLIVCPLGVKQEFQHDAVNLLNMPAPVYVRNMDEVRAVEHQFCITNYERVRDGDIDPRFFVATSLDEASVLRSFGSKTYQTFLNLFKGVPFKLVCTATPSPNKYKELIHYGGYLEVMDTGQALTRFFQRDSTKANNLTLYPHREQEFWLWLSTWALFIQKPSDLGYDDTGYDLPKLDIRLHEIPVDHLSGPAEKDGQAKLFRDAAHGLKESAREKRDSIEARIAKAAEIVSGSPEDHFILWHDLEDERHEIKRQIPEVVDIYGSQDLDLREQRVMDFSHGKIKIFATKPELSGSGCNFQRYCHRAIFTGIGYKFNDFIQAVHRVHRFLQKDRVIIDIIYTESEKAVLATLMEKWKQHNELVENMTKIIKEYGLATTCAVDKLARQIGVERKVAKGENWTFVNNDCVLEAASMATNSVDLIHTSIPFSNHYEYTPSYNDFGHNQNNGRFFEQMDYLTPELLRVLKPGRVFACHVKDRVEFGNATGTGMPTIDPFHSDCIAHYRKHGFMYFGMITVVTDVVRENNQTYRLGWTECCKDGSKMGVGCPEYVLLFRKLPTDTSRAYADVPVTKSKEEYTRAQWQLDAHAYWRSSGNRLLTADELANLPVSDLQRVYREQSRNAIYSYQQHVALAKQLDDNGGRLPSTFMVVAPGSWTDEVWDDVNRMRTLNSEQVRRNVQMHVCPLQFDIVERIINRFSNQGDLVFDPFGGIGTVPYMAVKMGRKGYGSELNAGYWKDACGYLAAAEQEATMPTLFDMMEAA